MSGVVAGGGVRRGRGPGRSTTWSPQTACSSPWSTFAPGFPTPRSRAIRCRPLHGLPGHREIRPLLAARGFAVPDRPGVRLRTLADVFAHAEAEGDPAADRRSRDPGPPTQDQPARTAGLRLR